MKAKGQEAMKRKSRAKAKRIEQRQEIKLKNARTTAAEEQQEKIGSEVTEGKLCASSQANSAQYAECLAGCKAGAGGWYGAAQSCSCFKCRHLLELAMHGSCSCSVGTTS